MADRFGRKPVLIFCTLFFGVMSLLTSTADSVQSLIILRFITGLGLGGAMPNAIALTTEYAPKRIRATTIMIMFCGFSLGAALGGVAAASLISHFGWKSVFVLGGIVPCLAFPFRRPDGTLNGYTRLKPDNPRTKNQKPVKYESPVGEQNRPYFPPGASLMRSRSALNRL